MKKLIYLTIYLAVTASLLFGGFAPLLGDPAQAARLPSSAAPVAAGDVILAAEELLGGSQVVFGAAGSQVYAFAGSRLLLYDAASPNHPLLLSQFVPFPGENVRAAWLYQGRYAFVLTTNTFAVLDLRSFAQPVQLTVMPNMFWDRVYITNNLLVLAGSYQMNLYQINQPWDIVSLSGASFATYPNRDVFVGSRYYRALPTGLEVLDFSNPLAIQTYTSSYNLDWTVYGMAVRPPYIFLHGYIEGRGYALRTVNFSDPSNPQVLYSGDSTYGNNMRAVGNYGFACSASDLQLFDLRDPAHPVYLGQPNLPCGAGGFVSGSRYYAGNAILDISDPAFPKLLGRMLHGQDVDKAVPGSAGSVDHDKVYTFADGRLAIYAAAGSDLRYLGGLEVNNLGYSVLFAAYPYLYLLDYNSLDIVNISVPATPWVVAHYDNLFTNPTAAVFNDAGAQDYLMVAHDTNKLAVIDVTNPQDAATTLVTTQLSLPDSGRALLAAGGRLYVACGFSGMQIFSLANPATPTLAGSYTSAPAFDLAVRANRLLIGTSLDVRVMDTTTLPLVQRNLLNITASQVVVSGNVLYARNDRRVSLFDITNPDAARWMSFTAFSGTGKLVSTSGGLYTLLDTGIIQAFQTQPVDSKVFTDFATSGGQFVAADGSYQADFPPCIVGSDTVLYQSNASPLSAGMPGGRVAPLRGAVDFGFVNSGNAIVSGAYCPFTLRAAYPPQAVSGVDLTSLAVYYWTGSTWVKELSSVVDSVNRTVTAQLPSGVQRWGLFASLAAGQKPLYLPIVRTSLPMASLSAPAGVDLQVQKMEPIQATNPSSSLSPLVAGKETAVRVYISSAAAVPVYGVRLALHGTRNNLPLPGSPLIVESRAILPVAYRENLDTTINVSLPASWLGAGTLTLTAVVDDNGKIAETNEGNNTGTTNLLFNSLSPLSIVFVPLQYTHVPTGDVYPPAENTDLSYDLRQIFPIPGVSIAYRSPVNWAGDLSQGAEWTRLLSFINELKKADSAATSTLYYGVIPTRNNAGTTYARTWGGYGYIGQRASVGVQGNVSTFAHEAGHNLSLQHGPCGGPSGPDLSYPYPDGRIGQFGVSAATLAGYNPVVVRDFMTYCYPEWISDYFYQKLYNNQRSVGGLSAQTTAVADVFVVRAFAGPEGIAIQPVYRLEQAQVSAGGVLPPPSGYWVDVLDAAGRVLASARLDAVPLASEDLGGEGYIQELTAHVPYVDGVVRLVIRSESASPLAERRVYDVPDSASQAVELRIDGQTQTLTWPAAAGWLRVSIRQAPDQPWQLYALDWPASLPLSLPPGAWQVHWVLADQPAAGHLLAP